MGIMHSVKFAKQCFAKNFLTSERGGGSCTYRSEPIKALIEQACSVSTESFKVRVWRAECWQNLTAFLLPVELLSSKDCLYQ